MQYAYHRASESQSVYATQPDTGLCHIQLWTRHNATQCNAALELLFQCHKCFVGYSVMIWIPLTRLSLSLSLCFILSCSSRSLCSISSSCFLLFAACKMWYSKCTIQSLPLACNGRVSYGQTKGAFACCPTHIPSQKNLCCMYKQYVTVVQYVLFHLKQCT